MGFGPGNRYDGSLLVKQVEMGFGSMSRVAPTGECHARRKTRSAVGVARSNYGIMGSDDVAPLGEQELFRRK